MFDIARGLAAITDTQDIPVGVIGVAQVMGRARIGVGELRDLRGGIRGIDVPVGIAHRHSQLYLLRNAVRQYFLSSIHLGFRYLELDISTSLTNPIRL